MEYGTSEYLLHHLVLAYKEVGLERPVPSKVTKTTTITTVTAPKAKFMASANRDKYHLSTCFWVKNIAEKNRVYFDTRSEAHRAGYTEHDCLIVKKRPMQQVSMKKLSEHRKDYKELQQRIKKMDVMLNKLKSSGGQSKKIDNIEVRLMINKSKLKKLMKEV